MTVKDGQKVYTQQDWTEEALLSDGFVSYRPVKAITMMRMLPAKTLPKVMKDMAEVEPAEGETVVEAEVETTPAQPVYWMPYRVGHDVKPAQDEFDPRPIESHIFAQTYRHWDDPDWNPTADEAHLQRLGCIPYYKTASIWAKQLTVETWVQDRASKKPTLAPVGAWLCMDAQGEPRAMTEVWFHEHYRLPRQK